MVTKKTEEEKRSFKNKGYGRSRRFSERVKRAAAGFLAGMLLLGLAGCGQAPALPVGKRSEKGYSRAEIMIIAMTEKKRYEEVCTDQIWNVSLGEDGEDFESYLTGQIRSFLDEVKIMNLLAADRGMTLTTEERTAMAQAAEEYYSCLTEEDIAHMGITKETVQALYEDYRLAERLVEDVTNGIELEVSDSEAKVISFQQAVCGDRRTAEALLEAASEENADFEACAENAGLSVTVRQLGRSEETKVFEDAAFGMETGELSPVIESGGSFYVLKCLSDYEEEATAERKQVIFKERKRRAFQEIYDKFREDIALSYSGDAWENLSLSADGYGAEADFFEIYEKYIGE